MRMCGTTEIIVCYICTVSWWASWKMTWQSRPKAEPMHTMWLNISVPSVCWAALPHLPVLLSCKRPMLLRAQESSTSLWPFSAQGVISWDLQSCKSSQWTKSTAFPTILIGWSQAELLTQRVLCFVTEAPKRFCSHPHSHEAPWLSNYSFCCCHLSIDQGHRPHTTPSHLCLCS